MASATIRHLDDELNRQLRVRAAEHGYSMEEGCGKYSVKWSEGPFRPGTSPPRSVHDSLPSRARDSMFPRANPCATRRPSIRRCGGHPRHESRFGDAAPRAGAEG